MEIPDIKGDEQIDLEATLTMREQKLKFFKIRKEKNSEEEISNV